MRNRYIIIFVLLLSSAISMAQNDRLQVRKGNRAFRVQQHAKSEVNYQKAIAANPSNAQAVYNLGNAKLAQQNDTAALPYYNQAAKMEKNKRRRAQSYHNIGVIYQSHQQYGEAIEAYKEALRCNPNDDETRYNLALCKKQQKQQNQQQKQNQNQNKNDQKNQQNKDNKDKDQNKKDQQQNQQQQQQPKAQMSKENAEQLLNAATQQERQTQQRLNQAKRKAQSRRHQKNW